MIMELTLDTTKARVYPEITHTTICDRPVASIMLCGDNCDYAHIRVSRESAQAIADAMIRAVALLDCTPPLVSVGPGGIGHPDSAEVRP